MGFGNLQDFTTVDEIVNSPAMSQVRAEMLENKKPLACVNCYRQEQHGLESFRQSKNSDTNGIDINRLVANTDSSGTLHDFKMQYWDVRFSNVCNLKCRMCGPGYSHSWAQELGQKTNGSYVIQSHAEDEAWDTTITRYGDLTKLREVYFAGGEVFFQPEHWSMLEHLKALGKKDVMLTYVTNLTRLSMGSNRIEDYLAYFTNVLFILSMDGTGSVFEYIRSGSNWDKFVQNLQVIKQFNVNIRLNIVITVYNILTLDKIFDFMQAQGIDKFDLTVANEPLNLNITNMPQELKQLAMDRLTSHSLYPTYKNRIDSVISYMFQTPVATWQQVIAETNRLDLIRNEKVLEIIPEFTDYWE
jgi:sulfatase maturation enzyme AslB (radical SAM superfamily)